MNNHAHILIKCAVIKKLSEYMHNLNTRYGCYYNKKYKRVGYVFRDRYKAEGIYTESHLYSCIKYIYDNPVKAGICNRPEEYLYSNYWPMKKIEIDEDYMFMEIVENSKEECKRVLQKFLLENNMSLEELKKNEKELHRLLVILKRDYKVSLREIAINFNMNREKVRRIFNKL
jgi:DNA-binding Lrp family transcriptional regulator